MTQTQTLTAKTTSTRIWRRLVALGAGVGLAAVLLSGAGGSRPAEAAIQTGGFGNAGRFSIIDTVSQPGATCVYAPFRAGSFTNGRQLREVRVVPKVFARNRTSGVDRQQVSYVATLIQINNDGSRTNAGTGPVHLGTATDSTAASLPATTFTLSTSGTYAVVLNLAWRDPADPGQVEAARGFTIERYGLAVTRPNLPPLREDVRGGDCLTPYNRG